MFQRSLTPKCFTLEIFGYRFFWISEVLSHILSLCWLQTGRCDTSTSLLWVCVWFLWVWDHSTHGGFFLHLMAVLVKSVGVNLGFADHSTSCFTSKTLLEAQKCKFYRSKQPIAQCQSPLEKFPSEKNFPFFGNIPGKIILLANVLIWCICFSVSVTFWSKYLLGWERAFLCLNKMW